MNCGPQFRRGWTLCFVLATLCLPGPVKADDAELQAQIEELVADLDADTISERDIAESNLLRLAEVKQVGGAKLLELLPAPGDNMPPAVRERLAAIRKTLEKRIARQAIEASRVTIEAINWPLTDVLKKIEELSGNKIVDNRKQMGGEVTNPDIVLKVENAPFWSAMDQVLDQAQLSPYAYAGEDALSLVSREPGDGDRFGRASYEGPFRFEVVEVTATRGLRNPAQQHLSVDLEIAWEPRLRPIAITQPLDFVQAVDDQGQPIPVAQPGRVFQIEVQEGTCATTITAPLELPERSVKKITTLTGAIETLVPGKREEFKFDDLQSKQPIEQSRGGVHVTLDRVVKNNAIWEVHMRLRLDEDNDALASHRGWVFNNSTYLVGKDGEPIDHAGFETTRQTKDEVGIAYLFDLPDGIDGLTWVYKSPVSIVERSYKYKLENIELP